MSLLGKIADIGRSILKSPVAKAVAPILGGPIGTLLTVGSTAYSAYQGIKSVGAAPSMPSLPGIGTMGMTSLGAAGRSLPALAGGAVRYGVAGAKRVYSAAAGYCRKHPQWCSTIGGIAAVEALINSGQLPIPKRRRGKGISATELKNFRRVARFTSQYCAPVRRAMSSKAVRRGGRSCQ